MLAKLNAKGQVTIPKEIRDRLGLASGSVLEFSMHPDGTLVAQPVKPDARRIRGLLKSPFVTPLTTGQMDEAIASHLRDRQARR